LCNTFPSKPSHLCLSVILQLRLNSLSMKTYKNIAIATNFSKNSTNAYQYARQLAAQLDAQLTIVHVYNLPLVNPFTSNYDTQLPSLIDLEKSALERLAHFTDEKIPDAGNTMVVTQTNIKTKALMGMAADALIAYSKEASPDLLILGIAANHDWVDKLLGSVAIKVMKEAHCPVLLIPEAAEYEGIEHILYTVAEDPSSNKNVDDIINFAHHFDANLHYIHVKEVSGTLEREDVFKQFLAEKMTHLPFVIESVTASTVAEGINAYCLENPIDLVVTVTQHRRFWDDLMHYSISKELGWQAHLPILCMHSDDDKNSNPA
jgi:nucleotide-binding universal stress UspA family protein